MIAQSPAMRERYYGAILPRLREAGRAIAVATTDDRYLYKGDEVIVLRDGRQVDRARNDNVRSLF